MNEPFRLSYAETGRFSPLVLDHLSQEPFVKQLSELPPDLDGLLSAARTRQFSKENRAVLSAAIRAQYEGISVCDKVRSNIDALAVEGTLTITTGHQLCLFTGPLYVPLKILNTVRVATDLAQKVGRKVVPIFWMATEDHDREEIDHAWINGSKITWPGEAAGAVGRMPLQGIGAVLKEVDMALGPGNNADRLRQILHSCYRPEFTLVQATRLFVNELFGRFGIVCLDADDVSLKRLFVPQMRSELLNGLTRKAIAPTMQQLAERYRVQANSREINLFLLSEKKRERVIELRNGDLAIDDTDRRLRREELVEELEHHPDRFSPNVLLRPLYQETILPNIAYIGGGGELAYWLQLRSLFAEARLSMPVLLLRSSVAIVPKKEVERARDLGLSIPDLFKPKNDLERKIALERAGFSSGMTGEREELKGFYDRLAARAASIDPTLERSAGSAAHLAFKGIEALEKRFIRAAKRKVTTDLHRLQMVLDTLFPGGGLQERRDNVMTFYIRKGERFFDELLDQLDPLDEKFTVLIDDPGM